MAKHEPKAYSCRESGTWRSSHSSSPFAIRDAFPVSPGHSLVVSRRVAATWFDATPEEQAAVMALVSAVKA